MKTLLASSSKCSPPAPSRALHRKRLLDRLMAGTDRSLWLITGQAAQGKTVLISTWVETSGMATAWLNLEPEDGATDNMVYGLAHALAQLTGNDPHQLLALTAAYTQPMAGEAGLIHAAGIYSAILPTGAQLVLDGIDRLPDDAACLPFLRGLIQSLPPDRRLILLSRQLPPQLERAAALRDPLVVDNQELSCTLAEVGSLLDLLAPQSAGRKMAESVHSLTGGWTGAVRLYGEITPSGNQAPQPALARLKGELFQHIAHDFFGGLPPNLQEFLLGCAPFRVLDPALMAELTGQANAGEILADLHRRHLFIRAEKDPEGRTFYRLHQLLISFLRKRRVQSFGPEELKQYLCRAGNLLAKANRWEEALACHLETGDFPQAGGAIKLLAPQLLQAGRLSDLEKWLGALPVEQVQSDPWLLYYLCQTKRWRGLEEIIAALPVLEKGFTRAGDEKGLLLTRALALDNALMGLPWSVLEQAMEQAELLLESVNPEKHQVERATLLISYGMIHAIRGYPNRAGWAFEQALTIATRIQDPMLIAQTRLYRVDALNWMGELDKAAELCRELDVEMARSASLAAPFESIIPRSYTHLLKGELDQARQLLEQLGERITREGLFFMLPVYLIYMCFWASLTGRMDLAEEYHSRLVSLPAGVTPGFVLAGAKVIKAIGLSRHMDIRAARELVEEAKALLESDHSRALGHWSAAMAVKTALARQQGSGPADLLPDLNKAQALIKDAGGRYFQTQCELLLCLLCGDQGDQSQAAAWMRPAVARCRAKGYTYFVLLRPRELADLAGLAVKLGLAREAAFLGGLLVGRDEQGFAEELGRLQQSHDPETRNLAARLISRDRRGRAPKMHATALGSFEVKVGGRVLGKRRWGRKQTRLLLMAIIALGPDWVSNDKLMEALWPDTDPKSAAQNLRVTLHRLRKALEPDMDSAAGSSYILRQDDCLRLNPDLCRTDVGEFSALMDLARLQVKTGEAEAALENLELAESLYQGDFLSDEPYAEWAQGPRKRLRDEFMGLMIRAAKIQESQGKIAKSMKTYQRIIQHDPVMEEAYQRLMSLQAQVGLVGEAMRSYQACRDNLRRHLGVEPGWATESIHSQIKDQS